MLGHNNQVRRNSSSSWADNCHLPPHASKHQLCGHRSTGSLLQHPRALAPHVLPGHTTAWYINHLHSAHACASETCLKTARAMSQTMPLSAAVTILVFMTTSKWTYAPR
ncbi:hypothetical protein HBH92_016820 [Parastagonospora nodorum]|nr:hypothetical protein HBI13_055030 [Parastagonospora nodorum]KAH4068511.1 hypothetical protein HBH50_114910 [Parastagonospora nodorum]KAH4100102.1 hypothetical protein HBH48_016450 [Parastagonospora nodorum]KAH4190669.1 hypothetical protein HBH42_132090 [Parastagonospora nodorum]KAH4422609.1 hypothetical protein HBH92_016820 [Parastagonospora nodorum]